MNMYSGRDSFITRSNMRAQSTYLCDGVRENTDVKCLKKLTLAQVSFSEKVFKKHLCMNCQERERRKGGEGNERT